MQSSILSIVSTRIRSSAARRDRIRHLLHLPRSHRLKPRWEAQRRSRLPKPGAAPSRTSSTDSARTSRQRPAGPSTSPVLSAFGRLSARHVAARENVSASLPRIGSAPHERSRRVLIDSRRFPRFGRRSSKRRGKPERWISEPMPPSRTTTKPANHRSQDPLVPASLAKPRFSERRFSDRESALPLPWGGLVHLVLPDGGSVTRLRVPASARAQPTVLKGPLVDCALSGLCPRACRWSRLWTASGSAPFPIGGVGRVGRQTSSVESQFGSVFPVLGTQLRVCPEDVMLFHVRAVHAGSRMSAEGLRHAPNEVQRYWGADTEIPCAEVVSVACKLRDLLTFSMGRD